MSGICRKIVLSLLLFVIPGLLYAQEKPTGKWLTIDVIVPGTTAADDSIYLYSNLNDWDAGRGMQGLDNKNHDICGKKISGLKYSFSVDVPANIDSVAYKFTRYDIYSAEILKNGKQRPFRVWRSKDGYHITDTVAKWYDEVVSGFEADTINAPAVVGYLNYKYFRQFSGGIDTVKLIGSYRAALKEADGYFTRYYKKDPLQLNALYYNTVFLSVGRMGRTFSPLMADLARIWRKNVTELDGKLLDRDLNSIDTLCIISEGLNHIAQMLISYSSDSAEYKAAFGEFEKYFLASKDKINILGKTEKYSDWLLKQDYDLKVCRLNMALLKGKIGEAGVIFSSVTDTKRPEFYYFASRMAESYMALNDSLSAYNSILRAVNLESDFIIRIKALLFGLGERLKLGKARVNNDFNSKILANIKDQITAKKKFEFGKIYDLEGKEFLIAQAPDKLKILTFWSVKDEKSLKELSDFRRLKGYLKDKNVEIYAVCVDFAVNGIYSKEIKKEFQGIDINYKMLMDSAAKPMFKENSVKDYPTTFLVDDNSNILYSFEGYSEKKLLQLSLVIDTFL